MRKLFIFTFLFQLYSLNLLAFGPNPIIRLGIEQGLSNNSVRCIFQDHNGFMWFGTYDGLNRYDGYEFKVFRNGLNDTASLPHNYIYAINEDRQHNLWVGTGQGIGVYNNLTAKFLPKYFTQYGSNIKQKISFNVTSIKTDDKGNVFIGSNGWGLLCQPAGAEVAVQVPGKKGTESGRGYTIPAIQIDRQHRVWLFVQNLGLCVYNYVTKKIDLVNNKVKSADCMEEGADETLWIGTSSGLYKYSIRLNSFIQSYTEGKGMLTSANVASLFLDSHQDLWIGTEGGGLTILQTLTGKIDYLLPGEDKAALSSESIYSIFEDREGRKWMGTLKGGINIIDPGKTRFQTIAHDPLKPNSLINNFVSSFYEDAERNLWIGTDGGGMSIWNRSRNSFTNYKHEPGNEASLSSNLITCIRQDHLNDYWIATFGGGINKLNRHTGSFEHFRCINDVTGDENKNAWFLYEDRNNILWATTFSDGKLYRLNRQTNRFEVFDQVLNDLISMMEDRAGTLWGGNSYQLIKIDRQHGRHVSYQIGKPVRALYEDKAGSLWVGTEGGGLILFNRQQGKIVARYSDADGLCNNSVLNILEDDSSCLWLSTFNGLSRFDLRNKSFKNFYQDDGLQSNQFLYNAAIRLQSGELTFGGIKGFTLFQPGNLQVRNNIPPVLLTRLRINNTAVTAGSHYVVKTSGDNIEEVKIPYDEAVLSFDFAALEYSVPGKIAYAYYLKGWDKGWNYTSIRSATYTNLTEGSYYLHIKATTSEGDWNVKETVLKIIVLPPWYRTWWAYLFYTLIICAGIYIVHIYKKRQERLRYQVRVEKMASANERDRAEKEHLIAQQQTEIAQNQKLIADNERQISENEKEIAVKEREINEKRVSFFTNIAHEFRSPLTLIINPVEDLLKKQNNDGDTGDLKIIERNSKRLLSLVNQLMLFRKVESEAEGLKVSRVNLVELSREVYLSFAHEAKTKRINYAFEAPADALFIYADREKTEIILYNLISNAIKYTPEEKSIWVSVKDTGKEVELMVKDTGYGFTKETGERIFDKFYRAGDADISSKPGFGIGLYMVRSFTILQHGKLTYESSPGEGTSFVVSLLKGAEHFGGSDIILEEGQVENIFPASPLREAEIQNPLQPETLFSLLTDKRIMLVVDDDDEIRQYVQEIFRASFNTYEANNGSDGMKMAIAHPPDIIISDIVMPGITGIEFCRQIKVHPELAHIPVLLLTGTGSEEIQLKGAEGGADDYLTKPFSKELLMARVITLLKNRSQVQQYFYDEITQKLNSSKITAENKEFLERCVLAIEARLEDDQFSIEVLARDMGMSHSNLYKKIKAITNYSTNGFIRFIRLRKAARLFIDTNQNVNEVAFGVGIPDVKYFRENFNKQFGMNPSEFIKKYRKTFAKGFQLNNPAT